MYICSLQMNLITCAKKETSGKVSGFDSTPPTTNTLKTMLMMITLKRGT